MIDLWAIQKQIKDERRDEQISKRLDTLCKTPLEKFMEGASEVRVSGLLVKARIEVHERTVYVLSDLVDGIPTQMEVNGVSMSVDYTESITMSFGVVLAVRFTEREFSGHRL